MNTRTTLIASVVAAASTAVSADVISFANDRAGYDLAVGASDLFVDFETNRAGEVHNAGFSTIDGELFSDKVTYSADGSGELSIAYIGQGIDHEIGPSQNWSGTLRWDYSDVYGATSFTGVEVEADDRISFFREGSMVASSLVGGSNDTFQFFGFLVAGGFDAVELQGDYFAIDGHSSSLVPSPGVVASLSTLGMLTIARRRRV